MAARALAIQKLKKEEPEADEGVMLSKLIAYCSKEAHSCVEKGAMIAFVKLRILETDESFCLRGDTVRKVRSHHFTLSDFFVIVSIFPYIWFHKAMEQDRKNGLFPFFVSTTVGTTSCCSADNLTEIGPVCQDYDCWLHVDAAYAGGSQICSEFRYLFKGIEVSGELCRFLFVPSVLCECTFFTQESIKIRYMNDDESELIIFLVLFSMPCLLIPTRINGC